MRKFAAGTTLLLATTMLTQLAAAQESGARLTAASTDEIIVTAQGRAQKLQDVPVAVSVVSGQALERANLRSLEDVSQRLPNVKITGGQAADTLNIRGIGSGQNGGFEQSVATFVDGIYRSRSRATRAALFDVDRVEVLKGPQTTFFGNNAIAGALNITTKKPGNRFEYNASALYAEADGEFSLEAGASMPVTDNLSVRAAGRLSGMDGYTHNSYTGTDGPHMRDRLGRLSVHFEPASNFRSDLRFDIGHFRNDNAYAAELLNCPPKDGYGAARGGCAAYLAASGGTVDNQMDYHSAISPTFFNFRFDETALTNEWDLGGATLVSKTGYQNQDSRFLVQLIPTPLPGIAGGNAGGLPVLGQEHFNQINQELRIQSSTGGIFDYTLGAYYSHGRLRLQNFTGFYFAPFGSPTFTPISGGLNGITTASSPVTGNLHLRQKDTTKSVFAAATIRPIDHLRVNVGLRYSVVDKEAHRTSVIGVIPAGSDLPTDAGFTPLPLPAQTIISNIVRASLSDFADAKRKDDKLMPSFGLQYDLASGVMAYASFTKGFKAGGFGSGAGQEVFGPESVIAYEAGLKGSFLDRRLTVNLALFQSDYKDLQEAVIVSNPPAPVQTITTNAGRARSKGVELGASLHAANWISFNADVAYLDSRYRDYPNGTCTILSSLSGCVQQDLSGKRRAFSPKYSGNVGATITVPVKNVELRIDPLLYFSSRYFLQATADPLFEQKGYSKIDLRVGIGPEDHSWELAVIGKNLTNRKTAALLNGVSGALGSVYALTDRPRSIAIQFSVRH